ncbi:MAG TPA: ketoacyl-ACP synthase III [Clostridiaceae bacterium]|nr:ketoacyl-ACP synthase III [Clostridiaceae bacterium]
MKLTLCSCGHAVPAKCIHNNYFTTFLETSDQWIRERSGIVTRHHVEDESLVELTIEAAQHCLDGVPERVREKIGVVIVASVNPERIVPSIASCLQTPLRLSEDVLTFDMNTGCSGLVYAIEIAGKLLAGMEEGTYALTVGAETLSRMTDFTDRSTCVLFGDAAAASLWTLTPGERDTFSAFTRSDDQVLFTDERGKIHMEGKNVFRFAVTTVPRLIRKTAEMADITLSDIDFFLTHQANSRIIQSIARDLKVPIERFPMNLEHYGNTSAASIGLLMSELWHSGQLDGEKTLCLSGFGAGLTAGSLLLKGHRPHVASENI